MALEKAQGGTLQSLVVILQMLHVVLGTMGVIGVWGAGEWSNEIQDFR